jgi:hypothetical protein
MDIGKTFGTNESKEEQGVWVKGPGKSEFLVARQGNKKFIKLSAEVTKPHRRLIEKGLADDSLLEDIAAEVTSRTVLLDWKGVEEDGKPLQYSNAAAKAYLLKYKDFADFIAGVSRSVQVYKDEEMKAAAGN